ncbi:MAG: 2-amino-4-hydroxy-6-hydroxymethyldihydropteridine diphosphokinase [Ruminococcus sp.]|nr:2-amino-4-hydroxy-6-hydroxymethyldihydropteridine diphosphokinase [Ruminococcus sp.]
MDEIRIDNLKIFAHHGVFQHENINGQNFFVNAVLYTDTEKSGTLDELECSTDYGSVCEFIRDIMTKNTFKLIETVANNMAIEILKNFPLVKGVDIEIKKPEAPIEMEFESVSVKVHRSWHDVVIALGSNMGDRRNYIETAIRQLENSGYVKDIKVSELIETEPYGYTEQADFLNGALFCHTYLSPDSLLEFLHSIENNFGRTRKIRWGERTLDLDIIFYDNEIIDTPDLTIPHIDMCNRYFVLKPVSEIVPYYRHPVFNITVSQLFEKYLKNSEMTEKND